MYVLVTFLLIITKHPTEATYMREGYLWLSLRRNTVYRRRRAWQKQSEAAGHSTSEPESREKADRKWSSVVKLKVHFQEPASSSETLPPHSFHNLLNSSLRFVGGGRIQTHEPLGHSSLEPTAQGDLTDCIGGLFWLLLEHNHSRNSYEIPMGNWTWLWV